MIILMGYVVCWPVTLCYSNQVWEGCLTRKANRIVCEWWEGIKNCIHVIRENLNSRYKSNPNIGKQSEDYCNEISIHQANSISEEKGTNGQRDTCILKNSGHDIYFVQPKCKLSPTTTVICNLLCLLIVLPGLEKARRFSIIFSLSNGWKALNRKQINNQNIESSDLYVWSNSIISYYSPNWKDSSVFYPTTSDI